MMEDFEVKLQAAKEGRPDALLAGILPFMRRTAPFFLRDYDDQQDMIQQSLITINRVIGEFDSDRKGSMISWIMKIMERQAHKVRRYTHNEWGRRERLEAHLTPDEERAPPADRAPDARMLLDKLMSRCDRLDKNFVQGRFVQGITQTHVVTSQRTDYRRFNESMKWLATNVDCNPSDLLPELAEGQAGFHGRHPRSGPDWADDAARLYECGHSCADIGHRFGISSSAINLQLRKMGVNIRTGNIKGPRLYKPPPAWLDEARRRYDAGDSLEKIGEAVGVSRVTVRYHLRKAGVVTPTLGRKDHRPVPWSPTPPSHARGPLPLWQLEPRDEEVAA